MAERCGPDFVTVLIRQPFALTLYAYLQLQERDRIAALKHRDGDVYRGFLTALAMNAPERLERERSEVAAAMRTPASAGKRRTAMEIAREEGRKLIERIEQGRVLDDTRPPASAGGA